MQELLKLYTVFFKIGLFTFGGGYSMLPMLQREIVEHYGWATEDELLDYFAIGQCTPGIIAVNTATLIGSKRRGIPGAAFATLGVITPSIIIITIIASLLSNVMQYPIVQHAFAGIRVAVAALIASAVIRLFQNNILKRWKQSGKPAKSSFLTLWLPLLLALCAFVPVAFLNVSPVYIIVGAILVGLLFFRREGV